MFYINNNLVMLNINEISDDDISFIKCNYPLRYNNIKSIKDKLEFLQKIGAYLLLTKVFGVFPEEDIYYVGTKPFVKNKPFINWSHSKDFVILGFSDKEIGVDIEAIKESNTKRLASLFNIEEKIYSCHLKWCKAEAMLKASNIKLLRSNINMLNEDEYSIKTYIIGSYVIAEATK